MAEFGDYLRAAREARKIPLERISATTRISVRLLEALENEQFERLPGGVFNVSFVRQYARLVGLDEEEAVARFKAVAPPFEISLWEAENDDAVGPRSALSRLAEDLADYARRYKMTLTGALMAMLLLSGGMHLFQNLEAPDESSATDRAERPAAPLANVADLSAEESATAVNPSPAPESDAPIQLQLKLTDTVWVRVVADGKRVLEDNLRAGEVRSIEATNSVSLIVGNAGGVRVALNGEAMPPIGPPGRVRRVYISPTTFEVISAETPESAQPGTSSNPSRQRET